MSAKTTVQNMVKSTSPKRVGPFIFPLIVLAIIGTFTASRTLDFLTNTLPVGQDSSKWLGLACFDGGVVFWLIMLFFCSPGAWQRIVAVLGLLISLIGVIVTVYADASLAAAEHGIKYQAMLDPQTALNVVWAIVIAHVILGLVHIFVHPRIWNKLVNREDNFFDEDELSPTAVDEVKLQRLITQALDGYMVSNTNTDGELETAPKKKGVGRIAS